MTEPTKLDIAPSVSWGIYVVEAGRLRSPRLVGPDEELVLVAKVHPAPECITVELYRGDVLRDWREWHDGQVVLAVALGRSATLSGSTRLRCRLLVDGRVIGQRTVLLGPPAIDAQGRLAAAPAAAVSEATRLAYVRLLEESWGEPGA